MLHLPWLFVVWMTCVGGAIGSFLNVVVYRMPAGISLSHPPSRCPKCETPIRIYDNIPVLGWLMLRGKCRSCKQPIAARYPIVEATVSAMFGLLALVTVLRTDTSTEVLINFWRFLYFANASACLVSLGLIDFDGKRYPPRLVLYAVLTILFSAAVHSDLRIWDAPAFIRDLPIATSRAGSIAVLLLHAAWSALAAFLVTRRLRFGTNSIWASALAGVLLGWLTPALPIVVGSVVFASRFGGARTNAANPPEPADTQRSLRASPVIVIAAMTYVFILLQLYRGEIVYHWHS